jgi:ribosome-associated protein
MQRIVTLADSPDRVLVVNSRIQIPHDEFRFSFARSSGPGGQNVNKLNTKAVLRWPIASSPSLPDDVRQRFVAQFRSRITSDGDLVLASQQFREQNRNVADCLEKLRTMLASVAVAPRKRKRTRPSRGSVERRLAAKRKLAQKKQERRRGPWD